MGSIPLPFQRWTTYKGHSGLDFPVPAGTAIPASAGGVITFSGWWNDRAGNTRTLTLPSGLQIMHCHLQDLSGPPVGSGVGPGAPIARSGWTGNVVPKGPAGAHLHTEMWLRGVPQIESAWYDLNNWIGKPAPAAGDKDPAIGATSRLKGSAWVRAIQEKYKRMGHDLGPAGVDGIDGPRFVEITRFEQRKAAENGYGTLVIDGIAGDATNGYLDWWIARMSGPALSYPLASPATIGRIGDVRGIQMMLKVYAGYTGKIDNDFGGGSQAAMSRWLGRNHGTVANWMRNSYGYRGNDQHGPVMTEALRRANSANFAAFRRRFGM